MKNENIAFKWEKQRKRLDSVAKGLPDTPGVYLLHDGSGEILYIGKARFIEKAGELVFS